ncbi:T9SS type A sorting domain-containing protein [Winogradskyella poriferorum]|uniref:T9SS type A sorting domain-containing protein n=1 Tax=Winogradskyella poriferorum TaxID=307627 RepID=UPI003D657216
MKKITLLIALVFSSGLMFGQVLSEDFEGGLALPAGWTINDIAGGGDIWAFATGGEAVGYTSPNSIYYDNGLFGNYALFDSDGIGNNGIAEEAALESPAFNVSTASIVILDFHHGFTAGYGGQGIVEVYNGSSWLQVASYSAAADFGAVQIDVSTELAGVANAQVRFRWVGDYSWGWAVDNIVVSAPSCADPNSFVLGPNGITTTSVDIAWTDPNGGGTVFDIEYGVTGFLPGLGTMVNDLAATSYEFTSLAPDTDYEFYITANCSGGNGDSNQIGPIGFTTAYDCSTYGLPYSEDFANQNAFTSCYSIEDANADTTSWGYNNGNDFDGDTVNDPVALIFPPDPTVAKDDWLFLPMAINGVANADYDVTVVYNVFNNPVTGSESFDIVVLDSPSSAATTQTVVGTYSGITQAGAGVEDLLPNAYTSTATYTPTADGTFYIGIHATTPQATSAILTLFSIDVNETLGLNDFESNDFTYSYSKDLETLTLESSNLEMTSIEIYSILGQNVISKPLSSTREVINIASLNDGVYLAKVYADGGSKTIKFVKN